MLKVLDISKHQDRFDALKAKAAGIEAVVMRAAYGTSKDVRFDRFLADCKAAGLRTGAYLFMTCHYRQENARDPAKAEQLLRKQVGNLIQILEGSGITGWVALDQELEQGCTMGLDPAQNTRLLNLGANLLRKAGYKPCLYCSASWLKSRVQVDQLCMPVWAAYYYKNPNDPDFVDCSPLRAVNTDWGRYLLSLGDNLIGWQFGRIGRGPKYGVASDNIDRDWFYDWPENNQNKEITMEDFNPSVGKQLRVTCAENPACEAFVRPDINSKAIKLAKGAYPIIGVGPKQVVGGVEAPWYMIDGNHPYVLALPDRCRVEDAPNPKPEPEPKPVEPKPAPAAQMSVTIPINPGAGSVAQQLRAAADQLEGM